jgi:hypothetical protein
MGYSGNGWDPVHWPDAALEPAPVVNLGCVVNVIENPAERQQTLRRAWQLAERVLIVSARLNAEPVCCVENLADRQFPAPSACSPRSRAKNSQGRSGVAAPRDPQLFHAHGRNTIISRGISSPSPRPCLCCRTMISPLGSTPLLSGAELAIAAGDPVCWSGATIPGNPSCCVLRLGWCNLMPGIASPQPADRNRIG